MGKISKLSSFRENNYYQYILWVGFIICIGIALWQGSILVLKPGWISVDDYLGYWAAGKLQLAGSNPYNPEELLKLQILAGWPGSQAVILWSPPWTLPIVMLLGAISYPLSRTLWMLANIPIIMICADTLWDLYGGSKKLRWVSWVLGFTFIPVLDAIKKGQTGILILLGIVGFLFFYDRKKPWLAGLSLALLAIKPHLMYLFLLSVLLWSIHNRRWVTIGSFFLALSGLTLMASFVNPEVIPQYLSAVSNYPPSDWVTPTIGGISRLFLGMEKFWLQFLPSVLGIIWMLIYFFQKKVGWNWLDQAPLIVLVSFLTASYGWSFDQPAALVAIIPIFVAITLVRWRWTSTFILVSYVIINVLDIFSPGNEIFLIWLAPTILLWYLSSKWIINNYINQRTPAPKGGY